MNDLYSKYMTNGAKVGTAGFIDVETTGLSCCHEEIIEFAICLFDFSLESGEILGMTDEYAGFRDPGKAIPPDATNIHGIRDEDVKGKSLDLARIKTLFDKSDFFIAHNASFDRGFVVKLIPFFDEKLWFCSMNGVDWYKRGMQKRSLQYLLEQHKIPAGKAHRAKDDVLSAIALLSLRGKDGRPYFSDLLLRVFKKLELIQKNA